MKQTSRRVPEKVEQAHGVQLLRTLGATVYILGHPSPNDGRRHRGTGQTPGLPDVYCFLPFHQRCARLALWWEVKAAGGRLRPEQATFRTLCQEAQVAHVVGPFDALIDWLLVHGHLVAGQVPHYRRG